MFVIAKNRPKDKDKCPNPVAKVEDPVRDGRPLSLPYLPNEIQEQMQGSRGAGRASTDEWYYRQDVLRTLFRLGVGIASVTGFVYLVIFWQRPGPATLMLAAAFCLFSLVCWRCLHLLGRAQTQRAIQIFIAGAMIVAMLFILFVPDKLVLMGMIGLFFLVRIGTFLGASRITTLLGSIWALLYIITVTLRNIVSLPQVDLWLLGGFFWYIQPPVLLVVFVLLDRTFTQYLKKALLASEAARHDLARSYLELERQKESLEKSEANLAALAAKVTQSNQDLQTVNEELNSFAYAASHDLQTPLRAVRTYADFLSEDLAETFNGEQKRYMDGLVQAVHEAEELVEDLLTFSRIGHQTQEIKPINVETFLRGLIASLNLPADVKVEWAEAWPTLNAEPTLLWQIFQNLILNAIKFNHSSPKRIELGWQLAGEKGYELFVRDNGIGIALRHQEQIFQAFRRLHTRKEFEGTGIGLAIVKKAVRKLDGSVRVESTPGQGSTFFVTLPKTSERYHYAQATFRRSDG